jgi:hypothetical protein
MRDTKDFALTMCYYGKSAGIGRYHYDDWDHLEFQIWEPMMLLLNDELIQKNKRKKMIQAFPYLLSIKE